jgi:hypothetical protein
MGNHQKLYPLLSKTYKTVGILFLIIGCLLTIFNLGIKRINPDILFMFFCFGLFCTGYSKEKEETEEELKFVDTRYHSFRIAFVLTSVIVLIISSSFIFGGKVIEFNALHSLFLMLLIFNISKLLIKRSINRNK